MTTRPDVTFTFQDWLQTPDDGLLHEVLEGEHVVTPAPNLDHQRISGGIYVQLRAQVQDTGRGQVFYAPAGVRLSAEDVVEPDLFVVLTERSEILKKTHVDGAPDLVVEILSNSTGPRDRGVKKRRYEAFGVREYWIVNPVEKLVEQFGLRGKNYHRLGRYDERIGLEILPDVVVDLTQVW